MFFQKQTILSRDCGVHALNNLIGSQVFTNQHLNNICKSLSSNLINPYKSIIGGNFDVTALIIALQSIGL